MAKQGGKSTRSTTVREDVRHYFDVLDRVESRKRSGPSGAAQEKEKIDIEQEIAREQKLKNDNAEQDIALKRLVLSRLFRFLAVETALVFVLAFMQAVHRPWNFTLQEWSFRVVVSATILQITAMLLAAVRYLFPKGRR